MLEDPLMIESRTRDGVFILDLMGDVTTFANDKILRAYNAVTADGARRILLNFRQNDYINSAGIAILINVINDVNEHAQRLAVSGLSPHFQKIFRMVGLTQFIQIYQTEDEAVVGLLAAEL